MASSRRRGQPSPSGSANGILWTSQTSAKVCKKYPKTHARHFILQLNMGWFYAWYHVNFVSTRPTYTSLHLQSRVSLVVLWLRDVVVLLEAPQKDIKPWQF